MHMAEQPVTRSEVKEIVGEAVDKLAELVNRGFTHQQEQINGVQGQLNEVIEVQAKHGKILVEHSERLNDLGNGQARLEKNVNAITDYHDQEIHRVLKHLKLKPLKVSE